MSRYRVWDEGNEAEDFGFVTEAVGPAEAAELYAEHTSQVEALESNELELKVRALKPCPACAGKERAKDLCEVCRGAEGALPAVAPATVKVSVDWEPRFYGEVLP